MARYGAVMGPQGRINAAEAAFGAAKNKLKLKQIDKAQLKHQCWFKNT